MAQVHDKAEHPNCVRLKAVSGHEDKANDVIFHGAARRSLPLKNLIFFPGDVQEYSEVMLAHRDNGKYVKWNLESTAELLSHRFPDSHIFVIKPESMSLKTFSSYSNFVSSSPIGVPTHEENQGSWYHLRALMVNAVDRLTHMRDEIKVTTVGNQGELTEKNVGKNTSNESTCSDPGAQTKESTESSLNTLPSLDLPIVIVGFSKGCVPLNQLLFDKTEADSDPDVSTFLSLVEDMYWLDGGHNGGSETWINADDILDKWSNTKVNFHAHVTPYQIEDAFRRWIGTEYKRFSEKVKSRGIKFSAKVHYKDEERSLENHFNVLQVF